VKQIQLERYGLPEEVARCVEVPDVRPAGPGEVVFEVIAFPINPADVLTCKGVYRIRLNFPATLGAECVGRVLEVGRGVGHVKPGDLVINLMRDNWTQKRKVRGEDVIRLPDGIDLRQAAMVRINPPTAHLLLTDFVELKPGNWIVQNAANSAVGRLVIAMSKARGFRTANVTRREDVFPELAALGADVCLLDGDGLPDRVAEAAGGAPIRLGLDAVGGLATQRLGICVEDGGIVANYGRMGENEPVFSIAELIFRGVTLTGFMLGRALAKRDRDGIQSIYDTLMREVMSGRLSAPIDSIYPIESIREALVHAQSPGHHGKILVAPNGMI
jgi:mitochondrial enoyl-[acyl-carrier protein] reductase / trans-2-enoyl-CoA reductase